MDVDRLGLGSGTAVVALRAVGQPEHVPRQRRLVVGPAELVGPVVVAMGLVAVELPSGVGLGSWVASGDCGIRGWRGCSGRGHWLRSLGIAAVRSGQIRYVGTDQTVGQRMASRSSTTV